MSEGRRLAGRALRLRNRAEILARLRVVEGGEPTGCERHLADALLAAEQENERLREQYARLQNFNQATRAAAVTIAARERSKGSE